MTERPVEIDLNADLGEGYGAYGFGEDEALLKFVSSANIACGFHAGDPGIMRRTVERCIELGVAVGAHPGLPDRMGFGRRQMSISADEGADWMTYQIGALYAFVHSAGGRMQHVKPHGALYHMAADNEELAAAMVRSILAMDQQLLLYGPPNSCMQHAAQRLGLAFIAEGFADRAYLPDGRLAPRHLPNAIIERPEHAAEQAISLVREGRVQTVDGSSIQLHVHTICLHGDNRMAAERAKQLAAHLRSAHIRIRAPGVKKTKIVET
jgi:UPF0271 protein